MWRTNKKGLQAEEKRLTLFISLKKRLFSKRSDVFISLELSVITDRYCDIILFYSKARLTSDYCASYFKPMI